MTDHVTSTTSKAAISAPFAEQGVPKEVAHVIFSNFTDAELLQMRLVNRSFNLFISKDVYARRAHLYAFAYLNPIIHVLNVKQPLLNRIMNWFESSAQDFSRVKLTKALNSRMLKTLKNVFKANTPGIQISKTFTKAEPWSIEEGLDEKNHNYIKFKVRLDSSTILCTITSTVDGGFTCDYTAHLGVFSDHHYDRNNDPIEYKASRRIDVTKPDEKTAVMMDGLKKQYPKESEAKILLLAATASDAVQDLLNAN